MTDTSNALPGEEPTTFNAPGSQEPAPVEPLIDEFPTMIVEPAAVDKGMQSAPVVPSIDEFPTMMVEPAATDEAQRSAPVGEPAEASTFIIAPAPLEAATYVAPAAVEPSTLIIPPAPAQPVISAPNYEAYAAEVPVGQPQYTPLPGTLQANPYFAPPLPDGQPGYYAGANQQAAWNGAPVPTPRKSRRGWLVLVIVLLVLLIGGGTVFALIATRGPGNTPTQVLQQYCTAYQAYDAQGVYNTLDAAGQASTSVSQIQQSFDLVKSLMTIKSCSVSNVQQNDSKASGTVTVTESISLLGISTTTAIPQTIGLVVEHNLWKIDLSSTKTTPATEPTFTLPTFPPDFLTPTDTGTNQ